MINIVRLHILIIKGSNNQHGWMLYTVQRAAVLIWHINKAFSFSNTLKQDLVLLLFISLVSFGVVF